jgi:hypothetical protein
MKSGNLDEPLIEAVKEQMRFDAVCHGCDYVRASEAFGFHLGRVRKLPQSQELNSSMPFALEASSLILKEPRFSDSELTK